MSLVSKTPLKGFRILVNGLSTILFLLFVLTPNTVLCQDKKIIRIGVVKFVSHEALDSDEKGFEAALVGSGFKEGVNVIYDRQNAQGDMKKAEEITQRFVNQKVDMIHSIATPNTQAVVKATKNIPIVFSSVTDPVAAGIVPKDSAPGKKNRHKCDRGERPVASAITDGNLCQTSPKGKEMGYHL
ncbi:MAG: hypothetical protein N2257_09215 [Thermodesulfovibrionales bacterium]|nr:hypothetical protein [Thermodesulfovibrionales bacterium]